MKDRLIEQIENNHALYRDRIVSEISDCFYRKERYKVNFSVAIFISTKEFDIDFVKKNLRGTDRAFLLESNLLVVTFEFVEEESGLKATENLLNILEPAFFHEKVFVCVVNSQESAKHEALIRNILNKLIDEVDANFDKIPQSCP